MANTTNIDLVKPAGTDYALVSVLNSNFDKIDAEAGKVRANFAGTYSTSSAYAVGAYCIYQGNLYRCKTAIGSGGEAWTSGHWDQVSVGTELTTLNNQIGNCSPIGKIIVLTNAITFTANASESFDLASYKDCYLLAIYTNSGTLNVLGSSIVTEYNLNHQTGALSLTKNVAGAWNGSKGDVVLVKPISV